MANANVQIILSAEGALAQKVKEATESVEGLNSRAIHLGESLREAFENLPGLLSGDGLDSIIGGIGNAFSGLAEHAGESGAALGPAGIAIGAVAAAAAVAVTAVVGLTLAIKGIVEPQMEMIDSTFKMA
ncbi:MAG: hypothetical protein JO353_08305, partial [Phycisphaerae bacterium]|nr:hypothetical protein [Phycisphaerae bacterium]